MIFEQANLTRLHYNDERLNRNSTSTGKFLSLGFFFGSGRDFTQFVGCTWQVFLYFQGEGALLACLHSY
jgi:hypothetical protein